jgi:hypothetical protein
LTLRKHFGEAWRSIWRDVTLTYEKTNLAASNMLRA